MRALFLIFFASTASAADLEQRLAVCVASTTATGEVFRCPHDIEVGYFPEEPVKEQKASLDRLLSIKKERGLTASIIDLKVGATKRRAIEAVAGRHQLSVLLPCRKGFNRLVVCMAAVAADCAPYLEALADKILKLPPPPPPALVKPYINSHFVEVPKGCKASNISTIECGSTVVRWLEATDFDPNQIAAMERMMKQALGGDAATEDKFTCGVENAPASCHHYHGKGKGLIRGLAQASNQRQLVFCLYEAPKPLTTVPPPCDTVLQFFQRP